MSNWQVAGGENADIVLILRENKALILQTFQGLVMGDTLLAEADVIMISDDAVSSAVASTPGAIGVIPFDDRHDGAEGLAIDGVDPTPENLIAGTYPVARPINMLTRSRPSATVKQWVDFVLGEDGQTIVGRYYTPIHTAGGD